MSERMIAFSLRKRGQDEMKRKEIKFANTLRCSMKLSMELGRSEVSLVSFFMFSGDVRDNPEIC